jgi:hypothetical protein
MKRFLLFAGSNYYPSGGWFDFRGSFDSIAEGVTFTEEITFSKRFDWYHIIDSVTGEFVREEFGLGE